MMVFMFFFPRSKGSSPPPPQKKSFLAEEFFSSREIFEDGYEGRPAIFRTKNFFLFRFSLNLKLVEILTKSNISGGFQGFLLEQRMVQILHNRRQSKAIVSAELNLLS